MNWKDKKYDLILCDPPWYYNKRNKRKSFGDGVSNNYDVMKTPEICDLNIPRLCEDDCVIYMWATSPHTNSMLQVMEAWGFRFITKGFTWIKLSKKGKPISTTGNYTGANSEDCWIGSKGKFIKPAVKLMNEVIFHPKMEHSRKPDECHIRLDKMYPNIKKCELFARREYSWWDCLGLELGHDFKEL